MGKLSVFNFTTLNGNYTASDGGIGWHKHGQEEGEYSKEGVSSGSILLFGRRTYEMMAGFWPTPMAEQSMPEVAAGMNNSQKIVFSRTMRTAEWKNTKIIKENIVDEIARLKEREQRDLTILGSGTIVTLCAEHGLIDEYQIMIDPVLLGGGAQLCSGLRRTIDLKLTSTRTFQSGVVLLCYQPIDPSLS